MRVIIAGGGSVGQSIASELLGRHHQVCVIDEDPDNREAVTSGTLDGVEWLIGDACELSTLRRARPETADVVVSATGDDKANLVVSLLAKSEFGVLRTVGRVNNPRNEWMFTQAWGVDVAVSTPRLLTALVEEAVEEGDLVRLMSLRSDSADIVAFTVPADSPMVGLRFAEVPWPLRTVPVALLRDDAPMAPTADDTLEAAEEVIFLAAPAAEDELRTLLREGWDQAESPA